MGSFAFVLPYHYLPYMQLPCFISIYNLPKVPIMQGAVQILSLIQEILPATASLIRVHLPHGHAPADTGQVLEGGAVASESSSGMFSSANHRHYAIIESDHPYKPATVSNYKVSLEVYLGNFILYIQVAS